MFKILTILKSAAIALSLAVPLAASAEEPIKTVYHMNEGVAQASGGLRNIRNQLAADPTAKIVVVGHGKGIDFMLTGATDEKGESFAGTIGDLASKGVGFRVCNNTLVGRNIDASKVVLEATVVPSGVAEIARLQAREGYVYLKP